MAAQALGHMISARLSQTGGDIPNGTARGWPAGQRLLLGEKLKPQLFPQMPHSIPNGTARGWPAGQRLLLGEKLRPSFFPQMTHSIPNGTARGLACRGLAFITGGKAVPQLFPPDDPQHFQWDCKGASLPRASVHYWGKSCAPAFSPR